MVLKHQRACKIALYQEIWGVNEHNVQLITVITQNVNIFQFRSYTSCSLVFNNGSELLLLCFRLIVPPLLRRHGILLLRILFTIIDIITASKNTARSVTTTTVPIAIKGLSLHDFSSVVEGKKSSDVVVEKTCNTHQYLGEKLWKTISPNYSSTH